MAAKQAALKQPQAAHPAGLLNLLADEKILKVVAALVLGPRSGDELGPVTGLPAASIRRIVNRLTDTGLVAEQNGRLVVRLETVRQAARTASRPPDSGVRAKDPKVAAELGKFFRAGRLETIPVSRKKLMLVLDYISSMFDLGHYYTEREVNAVIHRVHDDHATLRRYLVDKGFLSREKGRYWRAGGSVEVD